MTETKTLKSSLQLCFYKDHAIKTVFIIRLYQRSYQRRWLKVVR